jgi:hypothetical protein
VAITVQATYGWRTTYGQKKNNKKGCRTFSLRLDKEQGGYEALPGRPWLQPGWFMTGLIKSSLKQGNAGWKAEKTWLCFTEKGLRKFSFRSGDALTWLKNIYNIRAILLAKSH